MSVSRDPPPRIISSRLGFGSAGRIIQRAECSPHRVTVEQPMLILVEAGEKRIRSSSGEQVGRAGDALTVQAGQVVDMTNTPGPADDFRAYWMGFGPAVLEPHLSAASGSLVALHRDIEPQFRAAFERAFEALNSADDLPEAIIASRIHEVLLWLSERGFRFSPEAAPSTSEQVRRVLSANPAAEWSMEAIAHETACSVATLRRRLVAEGVGFRDLLQDVRMCHALTLLQNTNASVLSVAFAAGYKSASRFTSRFQSRFGFLPSDIRGQERGRAVQRPPVAAE